MGDAATKLNLPVADPLVPLHVVQERTMYQRFGKRMLDIVVSLCVGAILLPVVLTIALAIRIGLGKGVLYSQQRVGIDGSAFTIWKFRTMRPDRRKEQVTDIATERRSDHKTPDDPRHTGLGRLLRRLSLDELPQLWNVLRGDMSLVGPRPELVDVALDRGYVDHVRHRVRPGITGPYQLSAMRLFGDLRDGLSLDTAYVQHVSLGGDVKYLLRTVAVLFGTRSPGT